MRGGAREAAAAFSFLLALFAACGEPNGAPARGQRPTARTRAALSAGARPWVGRVAIDWHRGGRPGERILIGPGGLELGPTEGPLARYLFVDRERGADLRFFVRSFAAFTLTRFGERFAFAGAGAVAASPAERRMIVEWAHLVVDEAVGGRGGGASAIALTWHRSRDVFGGCDQVVVDLTGGVRAGPCGAESSGGSWRGRLAEEQLRRLYGWFDAWAPFQTAGGDADQPGSAPVRLIFAGRGKSVATRGEQAAVADFAANLYRELAARHPAPPAPPAAKGVPPKAAPGPLAPPSPEPAGSRLLRPASAPSRFAPVGPPAAPPPLPAPPPMPPKPPAPSVEVPPP